MKKFTFVSLPFIHDSTNHGFVERQGVCILTNGALAQLIRKNYLTYFGLKPIGFCSEDPAVNGGEMIRLCKRKTSVLNKMPPVVGLELMNSLTVVCRHIEIK